MQLEKYLDDERGACIWVKKQEKGNKKYLWGNNGKEFKIGLVLLFVFYVGLHIYIKTNFGDELKFSEKLANFDYKLFDLL